MKEVRAPWVLLGTLSLFALLWITFSWFYRRFPYIQNGSSIVFAAKVKLEAGANVFPADRSVMRVIIFGNSKILAGFVPSLFDELASGQTKVSSFNSGFPGSALMLPPLKTMCERGQAPNVLLLTLPWPIDPPRRTAFHFVLDDHTMIERLFPFRNLGRDLTSFMLSAPQHGGVVNYYEQAKRDEAQVIADRGYYLIRELSRFPDGRLPDSFHLASDQPDTVVPRFVSPPSADLATLNALIHRYHIRCYYVPFYLRIGEAAAPAKYDREFAKLTEQRSSCKVLGPDYFLYPNRLFADHTHLNRSGANVYTEALFDLLKSELSPGNQHGVQ